MFFLHNDHLGTPRVITDKHRQVVWKGTMKPFGELEVEVEAIANHRRFRGQRYDIESRLHYNYFRDYDPRTGRYVQSDPIGLYYPNGFNTYAYVANNPLRWVDPMGLYEVLPGIPAPSPQMDGVLTCIESCLGVSFTLTSTTRPGDSGAHGSGNAADVRYRGPGSTPFGADNFLCCAATCGAGFGLDEYRNPSPGATGPHIHIQIPPGRRGGSGDLPPECKPGNCKT